MLIGSIVFQDGCIVCPTTDSIFDLRTGVIKDWYPKNPVLRALTPALRTLFVYPVKTDGENIFISMKGVQSGGSAEIVFSGKANPGVTASDVNVDEVTSVMDKIVFFLFDECNMEQIVIDHQESRRMRCLWCSWIYEIFCLALMIIYKL